MTRSTLYLLSSLTLALSVSNLAAEEKLGPEQLPEVIVEAANAEYPGIRITSATMESENTMVIYEVQGEVGGKVYEVELSEEGQILEVDEDD